MIIVIRYLIFIIAPMLLSNMLTAQEFAISDDKENIFYLGLENRITFAVNGVNCKDVRLKAMNATIKATENPCQYIVFPDELGKTVLTLYNKKNNKIIGESEYRVKSKEVSISFGYKGWGDVKLKHATEALGLQAYLRSGPDVPFFPVEQFSISVSRKGNIIFEGKNKGALFEPIVLGVITTLKVGDTIRFFDVTCKWPDGKVREVPQGEFTIVE